MPKPYLLVETNLGNFKWYLPTIDSSSVRFSRFRKFSYSELCDEAYSLFTLNLREGDYFYSHSEDKPANRTLMEYFTELENPAIRPGGGYWKIGNAQGTWQLMSTYANYEYYSLTLLYNNQSVASVEYQYYTTTNYASSARIQFPFVYDTTTGKIMVITAGDNFMQIDSSNSNPYYFFLSGSFSINDTVSQRFNEAIGEVPIEPDGTPDPYNPDQGAPGYSEPGGGPGTGGQSGTGGNYDDTSDPIPIPGIPASIATGTGLFSAFNPDAGQLASLANAMWNKDPSTFDDWWRYFFGGDAFNAIIGLSMIPVAPSTGSPSEIYLGKWGTGVSAPKINNQYKQVDFGSVTLSEYWGNAIDYSPYTRVQLALPYIGIVDVDTDDVIGSVNTLKYNIDVFSGACTAMLHCIKGNLSSVIYEWTGSVAAMLPVTGASFNALGTSILGMVGASAAAAVTALTGGSAAALAGAGIAMTGSAASTFGTQKGKVQKSGSVSGNAGALGIQTPYFIISRPISSIPSTQQATKGYPSNISAHLGDLIGYTEISEVHLHNIPGTKDEVLEIESLLKKGVIF